jgi:hypothetical protein
LLVLVEVCRDLHAAARVEGDQPRIEERIERRDERQPVVGVEPLVVAAMPPKIDTALQLTTPPLADTSRYDGLRPALQQPEDGHA